MTLCAVSEPQGIGLAQGTEITDKETIKRLQQIGKDREHALKDYLIEQGNIASSRILLCQPRIDTNEQALPRIAISV